MEVRCVGCGEEVRGSACAACGTAAAGARFLETYNLDGFREGKAPKACCCCLGDVTTVETERIAAQGLSFEFEVPWCAPCKTRSTGRTYVVVTAGGMGLGLFVGWLVLAKPDVGFILGWVGAALGAALPAVAAGVALPALLPSFRLPGHVAGCAAYRGGTVIMAAGKAFARIQFGSRAFAKEYARVNG